MKKEFRILYVNGGLMDLGGISSYMINYAKYLYKENIIIDFVVHGNGKGLRDKELEKIGSIIYHVPIKSINYFGNIKALRKIFNSKKYNIVHSHMDAGNMVVLREAKKCGIPIRISHSHNTQHITNNKIKIVFNNYAKRKIKNYATHLFACSKDAGRWLYGEKCIEDGKVLIIHNAIELDKFVYNEKKRYEIRNKLDLDGFFVIGHVGRFDYQKNHIFILNLFFEFNKRFPNSKLLLIGDGILKDNIEKIAKEKKLFSNIIFLGAKSNINDYYNAMDMFILPSLFEGLGIVLIEAQANGLKCIASDAIPNEADLTGNIKFLNLSMPVESWVTEITDLSKNLNRDKEIIDCMRDYDIRIQSMILSDLYRKMEEDFYEIK